MRVFITLLFFFVLTSTFSQTIQPCVVMEYNERLKKTPLGNVVLKVKNAGAVLSNGKGECTLRFRTLKPGDRVEYVQGCITREGYEVFNKEALEQWTLTGGKTPYRIVMCKSDRFKRIRDSYEAAMSKNYREQRDREQARLKAEREANRITQAEYERRFQEAKDEYDQRLENIGEYIERFARIDLEEMSETEAKALELIREGNIEEAIRVYESLNLIGKKHQNRANRTHASNTIMQMWLNIQEYREENKRLNESVKKQVDIYRAMGGKMYRHKADSLYREAAFADTTDIDFLGEYYEYAYDRKKTDDANMAAAIIYNYYAKEFQYAPKKSVYESFQNLEDALAFVRNHKYSIECLSKTNDGYEFYIRSKDDYSYSMLTWLQRNGQIPAIERKKVLSELVSSDFLSPGSLENALDAQLELAGSTEVWPIIQKIYVSSQTSNGFIWSYETKRYIDKAFSAANQKDILSFFRKLAKEGKKKYDLAQRNAKMAESKMRDVSSKGENDSIAYENLMGNYGHLRNCLRNYLFNSLYSMWYCYSKMDNLKEMAYYEDQIRKVQGDVDSLDKANDMYANRPIITNGMIRYYGYSVDAIKSMLGSIYLSIGSAYRERDDREKYLSYSRLYKRMTSPDEALVEEYLEQGDTIEAIRCMESLIEHSRPVDMESATDDELGKYASSLETVSDLYYEKLRSYEKGETYALKALVYSKSEWKKSNIYKKLANIYERQGLYAKAVEMLVKADKKYDYYDIARLYWEKLNDAPNALKYLQKDMDRYDEEFEESEDYSLWKRDSYWDRVSYMHDVYISAHAGSEHDWLKYLQNQLRTYDTFLLHQKYVIDNNAHVLRRMILSSYANLQDSVSCIEFLDERAERMKQIYEKNPSVSTLYMYGDAVGYDYYNFYRSINNLERAEAYALKAAEIYKRLDEEYGELPQLANMYRELVHMYENVEDYKNVLKYCEPAIVSYEKLNGWKHLLAYLYIAKAWAKYKLNPDDNEIYQAELMKGRTLYEQVRGEIGYISRSPKYDWYNVLPERIKALSPILPQINLLEEYDSTSNYKGYEDWRHEMHTLRAGIIKRYVATQDIEGGIKFLNKRAEDIKRKARNNPSSTMLYVLADAVGYDYYSFYREIGDMEKAEKYALKAIEIYEQLNARYNVGGPLQNMYKELRLCFPNDQEKTLHYMYKYAECLLESKVAKNMDEYARLQDEIVRFYYEKKDYEKCISVLKSALENYETMAQSDSIRFRPHIAQSLCLIGYVYNAMNDYAGAVPYLENAVRYYSILYAQDPEPYKHLLASAESGVSYSHARMGDFAKANKIIEDAIAHMPSDADLYDTKGETLLMQGKNKEALKMWKKVLELDPNFLDSYPDGTNLSNGLKKLGLIE